MTVLVKKSLSPNCKSPHTKTGSKTIFNAQYTTQPLQHPLTVTLHVAVHLIGEQKLVNTLRIRSSITAILLIVPITIVPLMEREGVHYLPSLYFSILLLALLFDLVTSALRPRFRLAAATGAVLLALLVYLEFSPLTYASPWTLQRCERARWLKSWDFNCREFPNSLADYKTLPPGVHKAGTTTPVPVEGFKGDAAVGGEITEAAAEMAMGMAQPGQHAFEEVPRPAMHSGAGGGAGQRGGVAAYSEITGPRLPGAPRPYAR